MAWRRVVGSLATVLLGHLTVVQSLYACATDHSSGSGHVAASRHCQAMGTMAQPGERTHPPAQQPAQPRPSHDSAPPTDCCAALASCGAIVLAAPRVTDAGVAARSRLFIAMDQRRPLLPPSAPESPPPRQLGL